MLGIRSGKKLLWIFLNAITLQAYAAESQPLTMSSVAVESQNWTGAWGISGQVGTLGVGINLTHVLYGNYLDLRGQYNYLSYGNSQTGSLTKLNANTVGLLLDYKPFAGAIGVVGGLYYDNRSFLASGSSVIIANSYYETGEVRVKYPMFSPYFGISLGSQSSVAPEPKGFLISLDLGVLLTNATTYSSLDCHSPGSNICTQFNNHVQSFLDKIDAEVSAVPYYPVLSLSLGYKF